MDRSFWENKWRLGEIGFHQPATNPYLRHYWPQLSLPAGSTVLVPLCGKSRDMLWLAEQGFKVIGVELSQQAVEAFFTENQLTPIRSTQGAFTAWQSGAITLLHGDCFALQCSDVAEVSAVFDRAALVALPPEMRQRYATLLTQLLPTGAQSLLVTFEYLQSKMPGPPFSVPSNEVTQLFGERFSIQQLTRVDVLDELSVLRERGLTELHEQVYQLTERMQT